MPSPDSGLTSEAASPASRTRPGRAAAGTTRTAGGGRAGWPGRGRPRGAGREGAGGARPGRRGSGCAAARSRRWPFRCRSGTTTHTPASRRPPRRSAARDGPPGQGVAADGDGQGPVRVGASPSSRRMVELAPSAPTTTRPASSPSTVTTPSCCSRSRTLARCSWAPAAVAASTRRASSATLGITWLGRAGSPATSRPRGERSPAPGWAVALRDPGCPSAASSSTACGPIPSPHALSLGNSALSTRATEAPGRSRRASSAAAAPAGPAHR